MTEVEHESAATGEGYDTFEELVAAEANGWMVIAIVTHGKKTWPATEGPYPEKSEAKKAAARLRSRWKRTARDYPGVTYKIHVRVAWKSLY